ncbi:MAG: hypothetical protein KDD24_10470, partial [Flavobacteriales bacterium]|nr:hypothetical protein [Flavobacteriales bacterium]
MTAVAGILNKQGVAIAADSAVTVSGLQNRKVYNSANKIFTLSKFHPVGIAIYNNAQFMGIPWEILIKEYRKNLGQKSFSKLTEYKDDFFQWLKLNEYFADEKQDDFVLIDVMSFVQAILNETLKKNNGKKENLENNFIQLLSTYIANEIPKHKKIESLSKLNKKNIETKLSIFMPKIINSLETHTSIQFSKDKIEPLLINAYYAYITHDQFIQFTGLIFTGYGDKELFPQLLPINVSIVIDGNLRYNLDHNKIATIGNNQHSCI